MRPLVLLLVLLLLLAAPLTPPPAAAATTSCSAAAVPLDLLGTPSGDCAGIRPGAQLSNGCTMAWILQDLSGNLYTLTAGHCASRGSRVGSATVGDFGTVVVAESSGVGRDFALIKIDAAMTPYVNATLCHFGGPLAPGGDGVPGAVYEYYGWGYLTSGSDSTRARIGAELAPSAAALVWEGTLSGGDSGSPVMSASGLAMGIATHVATLGTITTPAGPVTPSVAIGTTLSHILALSAVQGYVVTLVPGEPPQLQQ